MEPSLWSTIHSDNGDCNNIITIRCVSSTLLSYHETIYTISTWKKIPIAGTPFRRGHRVSARLSVSYGGPYSPCRAFFFCGSAVHVRTRITAVCVRFSVGVFVCHLCSSRPFELLLLFSVSLV